MARDGARARGERRARTSSADGLGRRRSARRTTHVWRVWIHGSATVLGSSLPLFALLQYSEWKGWSHAMHVSSQ